MITLEQAKSLKSGTTIYVTMFKRGKPISAARFKITSIKTWKRTPERVEIRWKHGLYEFGTFNQNDLEDIHLTEEECNNHINTLKESK